MATRHRRAFSFTPETSVRLYLWAELTNSTPTGKMEEVLNAEMDAAGVPKFERRAAQAMIEGWIHERKRRRELREVEENHGQHFTF